MFKLLSLRHNLSTVVAEIFTCLAIALLESLVLSNLAQTDLIQDGLKLVQNGILSDIFSPK